MIGNIANFTSGIKASCQYLKKDLLEDLSVGLDFILLLEDLARAEAISLPVNAGHVIEHLQGDRHVEQISHFFAKTYEDLASTCQERNREVLFRRYNILLLRSHELFPHPFVSSRSKKTIFIHEISLITTEIYES